MRGSYTKNPYIYPLQIEKGGIPRCKSLVKKKSHVGKPPWSFLQGMFLQGITAWHVAPSAPPRPTLQFSSSSPKLCSGPPVVTPHCMSRAEAHAALLRPPPLCRVSLAAARTP